MAITRADCLIWEYLADRGLIPPSPVLLGIGQANWYGDAPLSWLVAQAERRRPDLLAGLRAASEAGDTFALALAFYAAVLGVQAVASIDLDPAAPGAWRLDLNNPIGFNRTFNVVVNTGTLEHLANPLQCLRTIHDGCAVGGLMLHAGPLKGWLDHGLFHPQPGLWWDLARANGYTVVLAAYFDLHAGRVQLLDVQDGLRDLHRMEGDTGLADGSMFYVVLRKEEDAPFKVPMQGVYDAAPDPSLIKDWKEMR